MAFILGIIVLLAFIWRSLYLTFVSNIKYRKLKILSLYILSTFFYFNTLISNLIFFYFLSLLLLLSVKKIKVPFPSNLYVIFLLYSCITLFYSESLWYGSMMILKLTIPFLFLMIGYNIVDSEVKFHTFLFKSYKYFVPIAILSSDPIVTLGKQYVKIFTSWESGNTYIYLVLICIPISLYFLTKKLKYVFESLIFTFPYLTLVRRASIGGAAIVASVAYYFKKGWKAFIPIFLGICLLVVSIVTIPALRDRFFGGDKGDMSGLSNRELLSAENVSTSGRDYMWAYVLDKFYVDNEIYGCGLGTMKSFLRNNASGETEHFEILHNDHLHILIETGMVGIILYEIFFLGIIISSLKVIRNNRYDFSIRVSAFCSLSMTISMLFCMYFGNLLSALNPLAVTFLFIGIFLRMKQNVIK